MRYRGYFSTRSKSLLCFTRNKKAEKRRSHESCCCFSITSRVTVVHKAKVVRTVLYAVIHALYLFSYALDKPVFQCFSKLLLQNDALSPPRRIARHEETSACELVENVGIMRYRMMLCHVCTLNAVLARSWQQSSLEPTLQVLVLIMRPVEKHCWVQSSATVLSKTTPTKINLLSLSLRKWRNRFSSRCSVRMAGSHSLVVQRSRSFEPATFVHSMQITVDSFLCHDCDRLKLSSTIASLFRQRHPSV